VPLLSSTAELAVLEMRLSAAREIALDVEGDGLYRHRARLCTVQFAFDGDIALVDGLLADVRSLARVLSAEGPIKVLHDCVFDARMLARRSVVLGNVFDTAVAARFLGELSTSLASLLSKYLGVHVEKTLQHADWGQRPLGEEALDYLRNDVRHLPELARLLRDRCQDAGILEEVRLESAWAASNTEEDTESVPWVRIKGAGELTGRTARSVLRALANWRESKAVALDVPSHRVLANPLLLTLARRAERGAPIQDLASSADARLADELAIVIDEGVRAGDVPREELALLFPPAPPAAERAAKKAREVALMRWRTKEASTRCVDVQVVLPGHVLRELASRGAATVAELGEIPGLGEIRIERYGTMLLELLRSA
jgi:ribonuclease D